MNKKKFFVAMLITIGILCVVAGGVALARFFFGTTLSDEITKLMDKPNGNKVNILLLGLDKDKTRSDTMMLVSVDPKANTVKVLSIPRDTRVKIKEGKYDKINHTMGYKNPEELVIRVVKEVTGMPINYYCEIDFMGFRNVIDILGGVEFDVPINMNYDDPAQNLSIHINKGLQHLNGKQSEGVVRFRATYVNGDADRIKMQQVFLKELFKQKIKPQYITKSKDLINEMYKHVRTNFSVADALSYVGVLKNLTEESLETYSLPGDSKYMNNISYFIYDPAQTKQMILEHFGYPEDEAKKLASASPASTSTNK